MSSSTERSCATCAFRLLPPRAAPCGACISDATLPRWVEAATAPLPPALPAPVPAEAAPAPASIDTVLAERGSRYGRFVDHAAITQTLKRAALAHRAAQGLPPLADDQQEALDLIFHKIGRIVNGDPDYADSWVDVAGYAKLVADRLSTGVAV